MTTTLVPRLRLDLTPADLRRAFAHCHSARNIDEERRALETLWAPAGDGFACLSVRSAFDLFLTALALPPGSEVLLSAVSIPDMARLVREHGLVPVPVDIDRATLAPSVECAERARSAKSRVLVLAHLLGGRFDPAPLIAWARGHDIRVVEDCAQGFLSPTERGAPDADVTMYSFGTIKTMTAVGGALVRISDSQLLARMRALEAAWPVQSTARYAKRLARAGALLAVQEPHVYRGIERLTALARRDFHATIIGAIRGFPVPAGQTLGAQLRYRPSPALLATLRYRLETFTPAGLDARAARGEAVMARLRGRVPLLGEAQPIRTHWLVGVEVADRGAVVARGLRAGFDLAGASNITAIPRPSERPDLPPTEAERFMSRVLFVPAHAGVPECALDRLVDVCSSPLRT